MALGYGVLGLWLGFGSAAAGGATANAKEDPLKRGILRIQCMPGAEAFWACARPYKRLIPSADDRYSLCKVLW